MGGVGDTPESADVAEFVDEENCEGQLVDVSRELRQEAYRRGTVHRRSG
jgi:hypothetical protein